MALKAMGFASCQQLEGLGIKKKRKPRFTEWAESLRAGPSLTGKGHCEELCATAISKGSV